MIWRPRCSDSSAERQLGKVPLCISTINRQLKYNDTRTGPLYCGFTLKIDNEIVGRTKHRDHTHVRVCSRCLLSNNEGATNSVRVPLREKTKGFLFSCKEKKDVDIFLFFQRKDPLPLSFLFYLISFLRSKVTYIPEYTRSTLR